MADFFAQVDETGIVEHHIQKLLKLEDSRAARLLKRYRSVRQELNDRLARVAGSGTFTELKLRGVLAQVDAGIGAMTSSLQDGMKDQASDIALSGVEDQLAEIRAFDKRFLGVVQEIDIDTQEVADDTSNFLLNKYESSLDAYGQDLINQITTSMTNEALMQTPMSEIIQKLGLFFQGEEWKLQRIARTEFHNIYNIGKLRGMSRVGEEVLPDLMKTLIHPMDARTGADSKKLAALNLVVALDVPFQYTWKGKERTFMAPPDRPNDRAILVPYRKVWAE